MGIIGGALGYRLLRALAPGHGAQAATGEKTDTKLTQFFGGAFFDEIRGKTVIDFGCGRGDQAIEMARMGAGRVIGIDIQERLLDGARERAATSGVADRCRFATHTEELADVIITKDAFEHFADPLAILSLMESLLKRDGYVLAAFGPTWLHPYGGHLFSVFPWAHLVFTENALIRWRADFKSDGARTFAEVDGGLARLTIRRFITVVERSGFQLAWMDTQPIHGIRLLKSGLMRELGSSIVRCKLVPKRPRH